MMLICQTKIKIPYRKTKKLC